MDVRLDDLLTLRWEERDRALKNEFLRVREEMNARGLLNSSITIEKAHEAVASEFYTARLVITKTILDYVKQSAQLVKFSDFEELALTQLSARKRCLERDLEVEFRSILNGL